MITVRRQIELETIFLLMTAVAVGLFFVVYKNNYQPQFNVVSGLPSRQAPSEAVAPKVTISSQISPDGTKKVMMKATENTDNTATYEFSTADGEGINEKLVFAKIQDFPRSMSIPFNTWSPDNKYFFIQENSANSKNIFVFEAKGVPFSDTESSLDVTDLFVKRDTGNIFKEATGWASETLIIINTKKPDKTKGPSYWLEVPSKAIIQLSTDF